MFWRFTAIVAILICGIVGGERVIRELLGSAWFSAGGVALYEAERRTINLFAATAPSVVAIQALSHASPLELSAAEGGAGSGFVWDREGHVVTNHHVIASAARIMVILDDGRSFPARMIGEAPWADLAVLKFEDVPSGLGPIRVGTSADLQVGQTVFAIGNPFGLSRTLTQGIVSALGRRLPTSTGREIADVIQTDAAINPGNSGGPLIDTGGRLVGVNTAIISPAGSSAGVGFAIPVDVVKRLVPSLIQTGRAPVAGIGITTIAEEVAARAGVSGVVIGSVRPGQPAAEAGLRGVSAGGRLGDIIVEVEGRRVTKLADLALELDRVGIGNTAALTILRDGQRHRIDVRVRDLNR